MKSIYCLFLGLFAYACDSEDSSKTDLAGTQADMSAGTQADMSAGTQANMSAGTQTEEIPWPPQGWSEESHTKQPLGLYDQVFKLDQVQSLKIVISEATYQQMLDNLTSLLGEANQSMGMGMTTGMMPPGMMGSPPEALFEACAQLEQNAMCQAELNGQMIDGTCGIPPFDTRLMCIPSNLGMNGGGVPPNGMNGGGLAGATDLIGGEPDYFEVDVHYQDKVWPKVAMRFKGNSSLAMTWQQGLRKIGFRLHFDHFEDKYPQIKNQRFFGFQELSLSAGASDDSLMRDALASYLLSAFDLPVAKASPYQITRIDENGHEIYWGLYTVLEDISDQFTQRYYGENRGNLYKPEGNSANWVGFDEAGFEKKNNASDADWSDIQTAIEALHADRSNLATWQENLEKIFNVDGFIKWLAVNQCIENWDVYGAIAHNYYLYGLSSKNGQLQWIPWDHNEAFKTGKMNIGQFDLLDVGENWPLIQILMSIPSYQAQFYDDVEAFLNGPYHQDQLFPWIDQYHALIAQAAHLEMAPYSLLSSETAFDDSLEGSTDSIKNHIIQRQTIAKSALDSYRNAQSNNMDSMNNP